MTTLLNPSPRKPYPAAPCGRCKTRAGYSRFGTSRPQRYKAEAYGYRGKVCHGCFYILKAESQAEASVSGGAAPASAQAALAVHVAGLLPGQRVSIKNAAAALGFSEKAIRDAARAMEAAGTLGRPWRSRRPGNADIGPCCDCGTETGSISKKTGHPARVCLARWGRPDLSACKRCYMFRVRHNGQKWSPPPVRPWNELTRSESLCVTRVLAMADPSGLVDRQLAAASLGLSPGRLATCLSFARAKGFEVPIRFGNQEAMIRAHGDVATEAEAARSRSLTSTLDAGGKLKFEPLDNPLGDFVATPCLARFTRRAADPTRRDVRAMRRAWRKGDADRLARLAFSFPEWRAGA